MSQGATLTERLADKPASQDRPLLDTLRLAVRFSLREMRGGLSGFLIFVTCIALGVAAIGGVNSVARAITAGVATQGQTLLGGDLRFELNQREASAEETRFLESLGDVAKSANMRSMARRDDGADPQFLESIVSGAIRVTIGAGQTVRQDLRIR